LPVTKHIERHFTGTESVRDVVIGMADGLTVPFALAAGLSAAVTSSQIIVTAGMAEVAAGAIAMGLGGYLAARTDEEHYASEVRREYKEIQQLREVELEEVAGIFRGYGLEGQVLDQVTDAIAADPKQWVDFMMRFELGLERPDPKRAPVSALTIAVSYVVGGLIPLVPYMLGLELHRALMYSIVCTGIALAIFGAAKGRLTGINMAKSAFQTMLVGGLAAGAAFYLASLFGR
jgi:VIT1/CCC1 family predicted Fe2+/Mn2+ transporter